jgi:Z1 domain
MMQATSDSLAAATVNMLRLDPPPTEAEIDDVLARMAQAFGATPEVSAETRRLLHSRFEIRMDLGETLTSEDEHEPWLAARRASIEPFYWTRYRELLLRSGWSPLVAGTLDRSTDDLLDLLGDPSLETPWERRGLVMGDVQSGKTASYAALIAKAADAGYRMIILLTGTLENVRRQTQDRLDNGFIGFDSRDFLGGAQLHHKRRIGVGLIDGRRDGIVFTSRDHDFRKNAASALNISLSAVNEPVLVVTKKNKGVLERLASWLRAHNADREGRIDLPVLLIDDEADNASVNTRQNPNETTAINRAIRDLLGMFRHSSYVGFTATPFANIFIDPNSTDEMLGDDLFPRDFIHVLEPPNNYLGTTSLFPPIDPDEDAAPVGEDQSATIRPIEDDEDWLPVSHKKYSEPGDLPDSLRTALRCFLLTCAIRDHRAAVGTAGKGGGIHRSMLVNVSHFTDVQNKVADALHVELEDIRRAVRLHGALGPEKAARESTEIATLAELFAEEFALCGASWAEVLATLHEAIAPINVQPVNQKTGARSLDYTVRDTPPGVRVIAVGGNSLSRGLTLEGLSTSYFRRNSKAYDTLLQMGRWFGYRDGYADLCRLWLTDEAEGWYRHVAEATAELKRDFGRMKRRKATPREFGLRVRTHPDTLLITARNKMASGIDVTVERDISLIGRMVESARLFSDKSRNQENLALVDEFFGSLVALKGMPEVSPHGGAVLWHDVPAPAVADMLEKFLIHPLNFAFQGETIAAFLRAADARDDPDLSKWTVALPTAGTAAPVPFASLPGVEVGAGKRRVKPNSDDGSLLVSGKSARVGGKSDVRHGVSKTELAALADEDGDWTEDDVREAMKAPMLIVFPLRGVVRTGKKPDVKTTPFRDGLVLPALALHFPGTHDPDAPKNVVRYRLNKVAQKELFPADDEADDEDEEIDAED